MSSPIDRYAWLCSNTIAGFFSKNEFLAAFPEFLPD